VCDNGISELGCAATVSVFGAGELRVKDLLVSVGVVLEGILLYRMGILRGSRDW
jgi:hypothetical protein